MKVVKTNFPYYLYSESANWYRFTIGKSTQQNALKPNFNLVKYFRIIKKFIFKRFSSFVGKIKKTLPEI